MCCLSTSLGVLSWGKHLSLASILTMHVQFTAACRWILINCIEKGDKEASKYNSCSLVMSRKHVICHPNLLLNNGVTCVCFFCPIYRLLCSRHVRQTPWTCPENTAGLHQQQMQEQSASGNKEFLHVCSTSVVIILFHDLRNNYLHSFCYSIFVIGQV